MYEGGDTEITVKVTWIAELKILRVPDNVSHGSTLAGQEIRVVDVTRSEEHEKHLYGCLAAFTKGRRYRKRAEYLAEALDRGFRKHVLFVDGEDIGVIEYAPPEASPYPVDGEDIIVMSCIWVKSRMRGRGFGRMLLDTMLEDSRGAAGFASIALVDHPSPWLRLNHIERLGFTSIDSRRMKHKVKKPENCFEVHLVWMPVSVDAPEPEMDWREMLKGVDYCIGHPLYRAESWGLEESLRFC